jgi:glycosyltransferase involved in cell wall biosynthesis
MTIGMLRVKNEARWIERSVRSILPICDHVMVMDDHSTDDTAEICAAIPGVEVLPSPFTGLNETRDKNWLLEKARGAEWIVMIDGDEALTQPDRLRAAMDNAPTSISMRVLYLWDSEEQVRLDGVYGEFRRHSAFRPFRHVYSSSTDNGFHCGNVPYRAMMQAVTIDAPILHFGYLDAKERERKYCFYNAVDPNNHVEDRYRHIAAGLETPHPELVEKQARMRLESGKPDLLPHEVIPRAPLATERTMHAGPLKLDKL